MSNLNNFGYKTVDRWSDDTRLLIAAVKNDSRPIEVGLYAGDDCFVEQFNNEIQGHDVSVYAHLDHRQVNFFKAPMVKRLLLDQISRCKSFGAQYAITHAAAYPLATRVSYQDKVIKRLAECITFVNEVAEQSSFPIFLENTFHDLDFYRKVFSIIVQQQCRHIHCCFDIGHAKIWSTRSLDNWIVFLSELKAEGLSIHFHLHANSGVTDEHLSLQAADRKGYTVADEFTGDRNLFEAIEVIHITFPNSPKIFEVPPDQASENISLLMQRMT